MYQSAFLDYYELIEDLEVEENINIDVLQEIEENYLRSLGKCRLRWPFFFVTV
jgi:hypothetical protein